MLEDLTLSMASITDSDPRTPDLGYFQPLVYVEKLVQRTGVSGDYAVHAGPVGTPRAPSEGHPTPKVGHANSQRVRNFPGVNLTPSSHESPFIKFFITHSNRGLEELPPIMTSEMVRQTSQ